MDEDNFLETDKEARANLVKLLLSEDETNWEIAFAILQGLPITAQKGWTSPKLNEQIQSARIFFLLNYSTLPEWKDFVDQFNGSSSYAVYAVYDILNREILKGYNKRLKFSKYQLFQDVVFLKINLEQLLALAQELNFKDTSINSIIDLIIDVPYRKLRTINLNNFNLITLPSEIKSIRHIKKLNLSHNYTKELYFLPHIKDITLTANLLTAFPQGLEKWLSLKKIDISKNKIQEIPEYFTHLIHLKELIWQENNLLKLPASIIYLNKLKILRLEHNQLEDIVGIEHLQDIEQLYLRNNNLQSLPLEVLTLKNLKILDLRNNPLSVETLQWLKDNFPYSFPASIPISKYLKRILKNIWLSWEELKELRESSPIPQIRILI